jgi:UDP-N-acetylmuramoylalanine--D-glutamate ligase
MPRIVILGAAESGVGAAMLAKQRGFDVFVSDGNLIRGSYKKELSEANISFEEKKHSYDLILNADEIIKSPGIPEKSQVMMKVRAEKISVISEIEFASRFTQNTIIAITGTSGKSTTTSLIYYILQKANLDVSLVGNIGKSFAKQLTIKDTNYYVCEISSFQLDDCFSFHPHIALLLNISENHLDRYHYSMAEYAQSKFRVAQSQTESDYFLYGADSEFLAKTLSHTNIHSKKISFSWNKISDEGAWVENNCINVKLSNKSFTMSIYELALQGRHNVYNSMAAAVTASILDIRKETIRECLMDFKNLEHRLEFVVKIHDVEFINDSKATNVNSTWYALESISKPIILILGGVDKGNDYSLLINLVKQKVKGIICLGLDNRKIHEAFSSSVDIMVNTESMDEAVQTAYRLAEKGDTVLLSPACASFDLFENYEDRGRKFKQAVRNL